MPHWSSFRAFAPRAGSGAHSGGSRSGGSNGLAPGLAEYINDEGRDPIDFTVAPAFFPDERRAVERAVRMTKSEAAELVANVFVNGRAEATALARHALDCLSWLLAADRLRLRIAVPTPESNYHPKIWLFDDGTNQVLARGSGNATSRGVAEGVEHLDVDVSWLPHSESRVREGVAMLDAWAKGTSAGIEEVFELPEAVAKDIIRTAPTQPPKPKDYAAVAPRTQDLPLSGIRSRAAHADPREPRVADRSVRSSGRSGRRLGRRRRP